MQQALISDQAHRLAALDPTQSFIVQAPAGSGKTGLLTERLLVLLSVVDRAPEECLAITFTRKAAFEMRDRILLALERAQNPTPPNDPYQKKLWDLARRVLERDAALGWHLFHNPNRLKIHTIDAFCMALTQRMPIVSRFGSSPQVTEAPDDLYKSAARNLLKTVEEQESWSEPLCLLLKHLDNNFSLAERLLAEMLSHRDQWLPYIGRTFSSERARALLESGLTAVIQDSLLLLEEAIPMGLEELMPLASFAAGQIKLAKHGSPIAHCATLGKDWPSHSMDDLPLWLGLAELLLTKEGSLRKTITEQQGFRAPSSITNREEQAHFKMMKDKMMACLEALQPHLLFVERLNHLRHCPPMCYQNEQWQIVEALVQLLPILTAELAVVFQEKGQVDFTEITLAAQKALGNFDEPSDLALALDYQIRHILIDEFQDTSLAQFRLLEQLTAGWQGNDGRTLFLVGDPMQSIYRFRQAEVGLFIRAREQGIGDIALIPLQLTTNFRSDPELITWTNTTFSAQFPAQDNITASAVKFHPSQAARKQEGQAYAEHYDVTVETESEQIVQLIQKEQARDTSADIAILVRSRSHLQRIIPALERAGIVYQGIDLMLLVDQSVVQDLMALTKALLHLGDRIAWLALLRSPLCGLTLADLYFIAHKDFKYPLWQRIQSYSSLTGLSTEGQAILTRVVPILAQALANTHRDPLRKWIADAWNALSQNDPKVDIQQHPEAAAFLDILEETDVDFFEVGRLEKRMKSLYAKPMLAAPGSVQIMTIHKAKGLEFDTVIVPGIGRKSMADSSKLLLWEERVSATYSPESYFMLAPIKSVGSLQDPIYQFLRREEAQRAKYEAVRLAYVAATRARKRLYWLVHEA